MFGALNLGNLSLGAYTSTNGVGPSLTGAGPFFFAHRSGAQMYPEDTIEGYDAALAAGNRYLEMDCQRLSDGALGCMHNTTVDSTTTGTGNVVSFDSAAFTALNIDSDTWFGGNFGNTLHPPLFSSILSRYRARAAFVPEAKSTGSGAAIVAALQAAGISRWQALVQAFVFSELTPAVSAGYPALALSNGGSPNTAIPAAQAVGATWVGLAATSSDAEIAQWIAAGFRVVPWTVTRRYRWDQLRALGCVGVFTDDAEYTSRRGTPAMKDNYAAGRWQPGMLAKTDVFVNAEAERGNFFAGGWWGWDSYTTSFSSTLQGWACPIKGDVAASNFTIDCCVRIDNVNSGDASRWGSVWLSDVTALDRPYFDIPGDVAGWHILFRRDGRLQIYKRAAGGAANVVAQYNGAAFANGEETRFKIVVTPTAITAQRVDVASGALIGQATVSDAQYRGGYFHFCRSLAAAKFRNVRIS